MISVDSGLLFMLAVLAFLAWAAWLESRRPDPPSHLEVITRQRDPWRQTTVTRCPHCGERIDPKETRP